MPRFLTILLALLLAIPVWAQLEPQPGERELQQIQTAPKLVAAPTVVKEVQPEFPEEEKQAGRSGAVVLRLTVDDRGLVDRVEVLESAGPFFDWSALGAGTQLILSPALFVLQPIEGDTWPLCEELDDEQLDQGAKCAESFSAPVQLDYRMNFELMAPPEPPPERPKPQTGRIVGIVREAGSKRPLEGVEVVIDVQGTVDEAFTPEDLAALSALTDKDGVFRIEDVPVGTHKVRLALSSYEPADEEETFSGDVENQVIYYLVARSYSKFTTVVRVKRPAKEVTKVALQREEVTKVPGTFGDPLRVIENLPGLARSGVIGGALLVRGANAEDSAVYFDSVEIPVLYHFGGLTSVINAEFLEDINFYPGGFGARYGRATAGIVDVDSRELGMETFRGTGEVDLLDSGFFFAGPIDIGAVVGMEPAPPGPSPQKITFAAAARRSYIDALLPFVIETVLPQDQAVLTASPIYWDYQTKVEYRPHVDHRASIMAFGSDDNLKIIARGGAEDAAQAFNLALHNQFHRLVGRYDVQLGPRLKNQLIVSGGYTGVEIGADANAALAAGGVIDVWSAALRDELTYNPLQGVELVAGLDMGYGAYAINFNIPFSPTVNTYPRLLPNLQGSTSITEEGSQTLPGWYVEARLGPLAGLTLIPGYRFDMYLFNDQQRFSTEPRLTARWQVAKDTTLKAAFGVYEQLPQPFQLGEDYGNPLLTLPRALHYIVGYEHKLTEALNISLELYFNDRDRQVTSSDKITVTGDGGIDLEFYNNKGIGRSYGAEVLLRHELSRDFYGWVAYTLARSEERDLNVAQAADGSYEIDKIAPWIITGTDQTHILTVVGQYRPTIPDVPSWAFGLGGGTSPDWLRDAWRVVAKDWSVGGRFRLVTGDPMTPVRFAQHDLDQDGWDAVRGAARSDRMPTFNQLDVRLDRKVVFDNFVLNFYLDLLNAYNMANVESIISDYRYRKQVPLTGLPIIPVVGVQGEF